MGWKPAPRPGVDLSALSLSPLQRHVASQVTGEADVGTLAEATGLPEERVASLLSELVAMGALLPDERIGPPASPVLTSPVMRFTPPPEAERGPEPGPDGEGSDSGAASSPAPELASPVPFEDAAPDEDTGQDVPEPPEAVTTSHRQYYETQLHHLPVDERVAMAHAAAEPALSALCFDPVPQVVQALLDNPRAGPVQARLIAKHHRHPAGLEAVARRSAFAADAGVRRGLLYNPMLPGSLYRRLWGTRRMLDQFNVTLSREVPDQTKRVARETLRARFVSGPAEERVELIIKTEGRCLLALTALPIDSKTTALLCSRTYASSFIVQNIARWSAAPPALIAHLQRQEIVRRTPLLRTLLERHPNSPKGRHV